jgi:hypothetical protein
MGCFKEKALLSLVASSLVVNTAYASDPMADLIKRLEDLESANKTLQLRVDQLSSTEKTATEAAHVAVAVTDNKNDSVLRLNHTFSYDMLDPTTSITRKQEFILQQKASGAIGNDAVYLGGAITAIADYQSSNTDSKFGYLMRHPTSTNQRTTEVSEAVIHSAQLSVLANLNDWSTGYMELLYDPEQSFGAGTNTALARNQIQLRQGYVLFGDLKTSPFYASIGKMATPFGLTDTVNPFSASTVWHAFGQLAYGGKVGYTQDGLSARAMAIQSGPQFRGANVPTEPNSAATSSLNNYALDLSYTMDVSKDSQLMIGSSYTAGTAYCQEFPVTHFGACNNANGAYDFYAQWKSADWTVQAEFAKTEHVWNGSFNPSLPEYPASKVSSWDIGTQYRSQINGIPVNYSAEFSQFVAGPGDSPWASQDQWVFGMAARPTISTKLFLELIRTRGYVPLAFMSGGNTGSPGVGPEGTWSDQDAKSDIAMLGANVAF